MTNLMIKARTGRTNALAGIPNNLGDSFIGHTTGTRVKTNYRNNPVHFVSSRAHAQVPSWIH